MTRSAPRSLPAQVHRLGDHVDAGRGVRHRAAAARNRSRRPRPHPSGRRPCRSVELGEALEPAVDHEQLLLGQSLLRAVGLRRADQPEQLVVDVGGEDQGRPRPWRDVRARCRQREGRRGRLGPRRALLRRPWRPEPPTGPLLRRWWRSRRRRPRRCRHRPRSPRGAARRDRGWWRSSASGPRERSGAGRPPARSRRTPCRRCAGSSRAPDRRTGRAPSTATSSPPSAACSTSTKPGPPSDIGTSTSSVSGSRRRQPAAIAAAASTALKVPANLSGATTTRMAGDDSPAGSAANSGRPARRTWRRIRPWTC